MTQLGNEIDVVLDFGGGHADRYTGLANPSAKNALTKGELALIRCGTDDVAGDAASFDEIGRFTATTKATPAVKATVKGASVFSDATEVGTCRWAWARVDRNDPAVPTSCAE